MSATPVELLRAQIAWATDRAEETKTLALKAIAVLEQRPENPRWNTFELMLRARAEALAGQREQALRDGRAALEAIKAIDVYLSGDARVDLARIHLVLGETDAALQILTEISTISLSALVPPEWTLDPILGRLNGDPRFERIIKSIKPL